MRYFDVLSTEGMKNRLKGMNLEEVQMNSGADTLEKALTMVPPIDFFDDRADLMTVPHRNHFQLLVSSHALEHQTDLVRHFEKVSAMPSAASL